jgi:hypothetical protein
MVPSHEITVYTFRVLRDLGTEHHFAHELARPNE